MKKKIVATVLTLAAMITLTLSPTLNVSATETTSEDTTEAPRELAPPIYNDETGIKMDLLWVAEPGKYDATTNGLEVHEPEVLAVGKTYEVAVALTNVSDGAIGMSWGIGYDVDIPRIIEAGETFRGVGGSAWAEEKNEEEWQGSLLYSTVKVEEDTAILFKDNSVVISNDGESPSVTLTPYYITLRVTGQGLQPGCSRVIAFRIETIPLAELKK